MTGIVKGYRNILKAPMPALAALAALSLAQGCIATRDWVREQVDPVAGRVTQSETRLNQTEGQITGLGTRVTGVEGKVGVVEGKLGQVDAKTEKALTALSNLRLERRFIVDMKDGANFALNSSTLPAQARKEIDGFMSDIKGDLTGSESAVILVTGHTDSTGTPDYNYELGKRRADAVSRYLITEKKVDPLRVVAVSYGETAPSADNSTNQGRGKNRRVEILVYRDNITSTASTANPQQGGEQRSAPQQGEKLTKSY